MLLGLGIAGIVVFLDQLSKYFVLQGLGERMSYSVASFLTIVRAWNTGVSFSMLNNYGNVGVFVLSGLALVIVVMLFQWLRKEENVFVQAALGLIMGGAVGNVIDRVRFGAVFDFLDFHLGEAHWPAFNVADSCICIGAAIIIVQALVSRFAKKG